MGLDSFTLKTQNLVGRLCGALTNTRCVTAHQQHADLPHFLLLLFVVYFHIFHFVSLPLCILCSVFSLIIQIIDQTCAFHEVFILYAPHFHFEHTVAWTDTNHRQPDTDAE